MFKINFIMNTIQNSELFSVIPKSDALKLSTKHGIDYKKVADLLEFDRGDLSKVANVSKSSVRFDAKIPSDLKDRMDQIFIVVNHVGNYFAGDRIKTALWFKTKNPMLGNISPRDMIRVGRFHKLMKFILSAIKEPQTSGA